MIATCGCSQSAAPKEGPATPSRIPASATATAVAGPRDAELAARARVCAALPAVRPADLVVGVSRHIVPHGSDAVVHRAELAESALACQANLAPGAATTYACLLATPLELDELWRQFRERAFAGMTSQPAAGSPHYGGRFLWLRWGGRYACEVGDSSGAKIDDVYDDDFTALMSAVEITGRKHL